MRMTMKTYPGGVLTPEDFAAIRDAVMETPRGRWFLNEYANRLRTRETSSMLDGMKRLENALASSHDALMRRLAETLADAPLRSAPVAAPPELAPRHMKYFKQDEEIFEPAPQAQITSVAATRPAVPKGARLTIHRNAEASPDMEAAPAAEAPPGVQSEHQAEIPELGTEAPHADAIKRRVVIIRHKPGDDVDVPMQDNMAEAG